MQVEGAFAAVPLVALVVGTLELLLNVIRTAPVVFLPSRGETFILEFIKIG